MNNKINDNACLFCDTIFTRKTRLRGHLKNHCKSKNYCDELEKIKEKFYFIMNENELLKDKLKNNDNITNNITNNVNNNNTNNNTSNTLNKNQINNGTVKNNNIDIVQLVQFW